MERGVEGRSYAVARRSRRDPDRAFAALGPLGLTTPITLGDEQFRSEELTAFEVGFRTRPFDRLFLDTALFYNVYDDLATSEFGLPFVAPPLAPTHVVQPINFRNNLEGETYGVEILADWRPTDAFRVPAWYAFMETQLHPRGTADTSDGRAEGDNPEQKASLRTQWTVAEEVDFDVTTYWTDRLRASGVPSYLRVDARLAWRPRDGLEIAVGVQNLFDPSHQEAAAGLLTEPTEVERLVYAEVFFRF